MELIKKADRHMKARVLFEALKVANAEIKNLGTYCKWKELKRQGGRLQVSMTVYKISVDDTVTYILSDTLGRIATRLDITNYAEIKEWLHEHNYKPEKQWHMENGMTEEVWNEWNGISE